MSSAEIYDVLAGGVDFDLPGNGGQECLESATYLHRAVEVGLATFSVTLTYVLSRRFDQRTSPPNQSSKQPPPPSLLSVAILVAFSMVYGVQLCYKLATRQLIFMVNPCHVLTLTNIVTLAAYVAGQTYNSRLWHTAHLTLNVGFYQGPILAIVFPVTNTLELPLEVATFWIQHIFLAVVPLYTSVLLAQDKHWSSHDPGPVASTFWGYTFWITYHFWFLHGLGLVTVINIGVILCPALSDPFGHYFRAVNIPVQLALAVMATIVRLAVVNIFTTKVQQPLKIE